MHVMCVIHVHIHTHKRLSFKLEHVKYIISLILGFTWTLQLDASYSDNRNDTVKQKMQNPLPLHIHSLYKH